MRVELGDTKVELAKRIYKIPLVKKAGKAARVAPAPVRLIASVGQVPIRSKVHGIITEHI